MVSRYRGNPAFVFSHDHFYVFSLAAVLQVLPFTSPQTFLLKNTYVTPTPTPNPPHPTHPILPFQLCSFTIKAFLCLSLFPPPSLSHSHTHRGVSVLSMSIILSLSPSTLYSFSLVLSLSLCLSHTHTPFLALSVFLHSVEKIPSVQSLVATSSRPNI